jgi:hypothetical protein
MAKIVQTLTRASENYRQDVAQSLVRDLDAVLEKLNTTFQEELKQVTETYIIRSILVTSAGTPSPIVTNNAITAIKSAALTADTTKELLTQPLIVEGGTTLTIKAGSTDSFDFAISYLNIKKEITT